MSREAVDCLIPTIDTDLLLLAENKRHFESIGTKVLISAANKVRLCRDKNFTADYFRSLGLKSPRPVNSVEKYESELEKGCVGFPAFIKPKDGSSSIDAYKVDNLEDLKLYAEKIGDYIIQPFIAGREYTIDIFCDYEGNPVYITPRERLAVRAGEVLKTKITQDDTMIAEMQVLISDFKPCGQITVQLIREETTGDDYYIEINPRFGGGAPLSIKAGADSAKAVIVFDWKDKSTPGGTIDWNENLHGILDRTGFLKTLKNNSNFEIDSKCPNSTMVPLVEKEMRSDSLLKNGTWAFLGSSTNESNRYLFWTSVDTNAIGAGKQIPVIVSSANGDFYISETTTATRVNNGQKYVAIVDHIYSYSTFKEYTKDKTRYNTLAEAYAAYKKQVNENAKYTEYKNTLPE